MNPTRGRGVAFALSSAIVLCAARAEAANCVIVEAHATERPDQADLILKPVKDALHASGCTEAVAMLDELDALSRPAPPVDADAAKVIASEAKEGFQKYVEGDYDGAMERLLPLVTKLDANPRIEADHPDARAARRLALVGLAMTHRKLGERSDARVKALEPERKSTRDAAKAAKLAATIEEEKTKFDANQLLSRQYMESVVQWFGDSAPIERGQFGAETFDFFSEAKRDAASAKRATVDVRLDGGGVIYINGEYANVGKLAKQVPSGSTSILIRWGEGPNGRDVSRFYRRTLRPGDRYDLVTSRALEEAVHTKDWCCFQFKDSTERERELLPATVRVSASRTVVLGFVRDERGLVLDGQSFVGGQPDRNARVEVSATEARRGDLGRFLVRSLDQFRDDGAKKRSSIAEKGRPVADTVALVVGSGLLVGGVAWNALAKADGFNRSSLTDANIQSFGLASIGSLVLGGGVSLWMKHEHRASWASAGAVGFGVAATFSGALLIGMDEDEDSLQPHYYDTAMLGGVVTAVGLSSLVAGALLYSPSVHADDWSRPWGRWASFAILGLGVAGVGLTGNYIREHQTAKDELAQLCAEMCASEDHQVASARVTDARDSARLTGVVSGGLLAGGALLLLLTHVGDESNSNGRSSVSFSVGGDGSFVHLGGTFQ